MFIVRLIDLCVGESFHHWSTPQRGQARPKPGTLPESATRSREPSTLAIRCPPASQQLHQQEGVEVRTSFLIGVIRVTSRKRDKDTGHCGVGILHSTASPVPNTQPSTGLEGSHSHGHMQARSHCGPPLCRGGTLRKTAFSCRLKNCKPGYGAAQQLRLCDFSCRKSP